LLLSQAPRGSRAANYQWQTYDCQSAYTFQPSPVRHAYIDHTPGDKSSQSDSNADQSEEE
jgi:hypothetical protein